MANKKRGQVGVEFNGKPLNLSLTFNSFCELEDHYDKNITEIISKFATDSASGSTSLKDARALLWASMREGMPDASLHDAGILAGEIGQEKLGTVVADVLNNCGLFDAGDTGGKGPSGKPKSKKPSTA